ncbi:MAG TPA: hypothetical protein VMV15_13915 [Candidatus Binataceae bacterium]|nr:hypothetical protein [Candidatus Binataceae bacterium]
MRRLNSSSTTSNGAGSRRTSTSFRYTLIFAIGAGFGSILATLIGLEYTSWVILALCWPLAMVFATLERPRERQPRILSAGRSWYMKAKRRSTPTPDRPPLNPKSNGLRRVK